MRLGWLGMARLAWHVSVGSARHGKAQHGLVGLVGLANLKKFDGEQAQHGRLGMARWTRHGLVGSARHGWLGTAGLARLGWLGAARLAQHSSVKPKKNLVVWSCGVRPTMFSAG